MRKILKNSISSLFLRGEDKLSSEITFFDTIELFVVRDIFSPYYALAKQLFPCSKIVLDRFHIVQHLSRAMSRIRVQIMNQFERKSHEYKTIKRYWKLIQQNSRKLSDKQFYRPTFRMHLTNKEILDKLLSYSEDLRHHYNIYQLLLFHFQNKEPDKFFGLIEDNLKLVHPLFQTVFKTFLKDKEPFFLHKNRLYKIYRGVTHYKYYRAKASRNCLGAFFSSNGFFDLSDWTSRLH